MSPRGAWVSVLDIAVQEESPQHDLAEARRLIEKHGYWRRKEELENAEATILAR